MCGGDHSVGGSADGSIGTMIAATEPTGGAATPKDPGGLPKRDQAHRQHDQPALSAPQLDRPFGFSFGKFARESVRIHERREVKHMLKLFTFAQAAADSLRRREEGQTMAEYGVVLAVICIAVLVSIQALSGGISGAIDAVTAILPS
jgi:Flp pilus assembly pilin Flp